MKKTGALILLPILILMLSPLMLTANANYETGFDNTVPGSVPSPFTYTSTNSQCLSGAVTQDPAAVSIPNDFQFTMSSACSAQAETGTLSLTVNASQTFIEVSWFQVISAQSGVIPSNDNLTLQISGPGIASSSPPQFTTSLADLSYINTANWTKISGSVFTEIGKSYTISLGIQTVPVTGLYSFTIAIDNLDIYNASPIQTSNFIIADENTGQWFNLPQAAPLTTIIVTYSDGSSYQIITKIPDLVLPLIHGNATATLITAWDGSSYYRTMIPSLYSTNMMYFPSPNQPVYSYTFTVADFTATFVTGSKYILYYDGVPVQSGYLDQADAFQAYLTPGTYGITITSPSPSSATFVGTVTVGTTTTSISILISSLPTKNPTNGFSLQTYSAYWNYNNTAILVTYNDNSNSTTLITVQISKANFTGLYTVFSQTYTMAAYNNNNPWGYFQTTIPADNTNLNSSMADELSVMLTVNTFEANNIVLGPTAVYGTSVLPTALSIPNTLFGLNYIIPNPNAWLWMISLGVIVLFAVLFSAQTAPFGLLVLSILEAVLVSIGWLPLTMTTAITMVLIAFLAFMTWREQHD